MNKNFASNLISQDSIEQNYLSKIVEESVFGVFYCAKISISVLNFSTESVKKPTVYDLLFLIAIYYPKNDNKHSSEMRSYHHSNYFTLTEVCTGFGPILTTDLKY